MGAIKGEAGNVVDHILESHRDGKTVRMTPGLFDEICSALKGLVGEQPRPGTVWQIIGLTGHTLRLTNWDFSDSRYSGHRALGSKVCY